MNMQTSAVIQSGSGVVDAAGFDATTAKYAVPPGERESRGVHPVWRAGIRGENVLVGVGDSGLDVGSCWLADPTNAPPGPRHRKIRRYNAVWGDEVDANGHGTHVVSTILGEAVVGSPIGASEYDGMAPRAKVVFNDIGVGVGGSLFLPTSMAAYFDTAYADGARIHSDSWGNDAPLYDGLAREVDEYAWSHRDFLPVFAAGNFGLSAGAPSTVTSPATCKNGVAVGASLGWSGPNVASAVVGDSATMNVRSLNVPGTVEAFTVYMAAVGADRFATGAQPVRLVAASPPDACSNFTVRFPGAVVLVTRGGCYFSDKIIHAQDAGAVGVIVANDDVTGFFKIGARDGDASARLVRVPAASVPASSHRKLLAAMPCVVTFHPARLSPKRVDHIASFSSFGATTDGRIKPDVVAPGEITSASAAAAGGGDSSERGAFPNCAVTTIAGTSMATPVAAGAAALIRQYFTDGFYPTGARTKGNGFAPSAALIKAALINGAEPMRGFTELGLPLEPPPSVRQGHGRVHVGRSLPLAPGPARMFAVDERRIAHGEVHSFCLELPPGRDAPESTTDADDELRVTLVWTDPPASLPSAGRTLVNDLDLVVVNGDGVAWGGGDRSNNVERVTVPLTIDGTQGGDGAASFVARVVARDVRWVPGGESGQPYALVATAPGLTGGPCGARELSVAARAGDDIDFSGG
ncbi:ATP-binding cassette superfamily [Micromonas commoda]|uniref:ATP-binding cassette superfamily n=1 Tax=Micromonas commoda (strain RCC299 / NOUM17 / CCMP2709) TaxID=296587 RepID=C1EE69_MICCC|nr:ATP-binding cassette superfamily [Micromonas commoda]ACO66180.1 ATP-binding cassette superfamily [Micromonas commoda]|eukprot:XP_002504922.1 ATP-binding cassette superfamily [Micromonas commoda]